MTELAKSAVLFQELMQAQLARIDRIKATQNSVVDKGVKPIVIGVCPGDGIGQVITEQAIRVLKEVLREAITSKDIHIRMVDGLTIENRAYHKQAIPEDTLAALKQCHVILKGPTTTPQAGDQWPNIESANVAMRRELDLFACFRPISIPEKNIHWAFFRENTEGAYALGSKGIEISPELFVDFKVTTRVGSERIIKMAFEYAKQHGKKRVTVVTKSNVIKTTDGCFSNTAKRIAQEYEKYDITCDEWYVDIMAAKLIDSKRASQFEVLVMPNLYGDILTDQAGQIQGGVGTAGSANIGAHYAMFEAVHGSAPRMVAEGRECYADPSSMIKAASLLLNHIGYTSQSELVDLALQRITAPDSHVVITGDASGVTNTAFTSHLISLLPSLKTKG